MRLGVNGRFFQARPTGVQRFAREVVGRLAATEDLTLLLPAAHSREEDLPEGVTVVRGRLRGHAWEQLELPRLAAAVDIVLHPANTAPLSGPPGVLVLHDVLPFTHPELFRPLYGAWTRFNTRRCVGRARALLTVSSWSAAEIHRVLGVAADRVQVIPQAAGPFDAPASSDQVEDTLRRHELGRPYFLSLAGGDPRKGLDFLRVTWQQADAPDAELVVVGSAYGAVHPGVNGTSQERVRLLGHVPDEELRALYTGSVALLHPAVAEGFGRPPLEAMACGTRVVAAPYGPAREVLDDAGEIVPLDPPTWAAVLGKLLREDPAAREVAVHRGIERARGFSWDRTVEGIASACRACAESPS